MFRATTVLGLATLVTFCGFAGSGKPVRMLWAGSSSVYYHDLPDQVARTLDVARPGVRHTAEIVGRSGDSIQVYQQPGTFQPEYGLAEGQTFLDKIRDGAYNYVVLQVVTHFMMNSRGEELDAAVDAYCKAIHQSGAKPVIYEMGWNREALNNEGRARVMKAARRNRVRYYAPCSRAWKRVQEERPDLELHNLPDRTHPGTLGHYLNLAVFTSTFTGKPPDLVRPTYSWWPALDDQGRQEGAARLGTIRDPYVEALPRFLQVRSVMAKEHVLDGATAAYLQKVAWEAVTAAQRELNAQ